MLFAMTIRIPTQRSHPCCALFLAIAFSILGVAPNSSAQEAAAAESANAAYTRVITERTQKIVDPLGIDDSAKAIRVRDIIVNQYRSLSQIHDARDKAIKVTRAEAADSDKSVETIQNDAIAKTYRLHAEFLARLSVELTPEQVEVVKDGMTYGVAPNTYNVYMKMMPDLSDEQKRQVKAWLVEAREIAMDQGSAKEKHAVFGKYKGKINNYLSAAGYNLKEAEKNLYK
jgi:hypothetical protein